MLTRIRHQQQPVARSKRRSGRRERVRRSNAGPAALQSAQILYGLERRSRCGLQRSLPSWTGQIAASTSQPGPVKKRMMLTWWLPSAVKDKANHAVVLDKATADKLQKDVQSYRLITVATLVDRLKINGSLARKALSDLEEKGLIKKVVGHSKLVVYSK